MLPRGWAALALVAAATSSARAQTATDGFGIERFRPAIDRAGLLGVDVAAVPGHLTWGAGVLLGFAHDPLVIYDRQMNAVESVVDRRLTTTLVGAVGLSDRFELGTTIDIVGYQAGEGSILMQSLPKGGIGDIRLVAKALLVGDARYQVALVPALLIPGGSADGYLREAGVSFAPAVAVSGRAGSVRGAINLGYQLRKRVDSAGLIIDDEAFAKLGAGVLLGERRAPLAELWWSTSIAAPLASPDKNQIALEMLGGAQRQVTPTVGVFVAGGIGLDNGFGTPDWRALAGVRFEVEGGDRDNDGIAGAADHCPDEAEDKDGFEDGDGCPDPDNDHDGIADAADKCPLEAEDKDGFQDGDGCIDPDNDGDGVADAQDKCPAQAEDKDGFEDDDGCIDAPSHLTGVVVDPDGRPIRGAQVRIAQPDAKDAPVIELVAGEDGTFTTELHGGHLDVSAKAGEYQPGQTQSTLAAGTTGKVEVKLVRKVRQGQLRGQVLSFEGKPLAATIKVNGKTTAEASTDADGQFTIELPEGAFAVEIESTGYVTQKRNVSIKLDGVTVLNVDLRGTK